MSLSSKFEEAKTRKKLELEDISRLERLQAVIASFELGVNCKIELLTDRRPLLSISASEFKTYTENASPFHPVKLLLHADGRYEVRVNVVEHAKTGKYEFDNLDFLRSHNEGQQPEPTMYLSGP